MQQQNEYTSALIAHTTIHRSGFLPAQIRMTLNDLDCPIQLKVRMSHGLLAVDTSLASLYKLQQQMQ